MRNNGYSISFCSDENVLKLDSGDSCTTLWIHFKNTELYVLEVKFNGMWIIPQKPFVSEWEVWCVFIWYRRFRSWSSKSTMREQNTLCFQHISPLSCHFNSWLEFLGYFFLCHIIFNPKALGWSKSFSLSLKFNLCLNIYKYIRRKDENKNLNTECNLGKSLAEIQHES